MDNSSLIVSLACFALLVFACLAVLHYNFQKMRIKDLNNDPDKTECCIWDDEDLGFISARIIKKDEKGIEVKICGSEQTRTVKEIYPRDLALGL